MAAQKIPYGSVGSTAAMGRLVRHHRKLIQLTLKSAASFTNVSVRF